VHWQAGFRTTLNEVAETDWQHSSPAAFTSATSRINREKLARRAPPALSSQRAVFLESPRDRRLTPSLRHPSSLAGVHAMQGNQRVIDALNAGLTIELTAINQYFVQAKMCMNWGLHKLGKKHYAESMGEMKHAEKLIDRIIFLEGVPEIARYDVIRVGSTVPEQFQNDLALEMKGVMGYREAVQICEAEHDAASRDLITPILVESEEHVDWLESQLDLISKMGLEIYLGHQMGEHEEGH
jgi:bacterioferritin